MNYGVDIVVLGIVAFCVWRGYKNGLVRGIFGTVAIVASIFGANLLATAYSGEFEGMLNPFVGGVVDRAIAQVTGTGEFADEAPAVPSGEKKSIPEISFETLKVIGLSDSASGLLSDAVSGEVKNIGRELGGSVTSRLCSSLAFIAVFVICFLLITIVFAVIGNLINLVFAMPGLKLVDRLTGLVFGLAKGLAIVFALALALRYFGFGLSEAIEKTSVLKYIINNNPLAGILGV